MASEAEANEAEGAGESSGLHQPHDKLFTAAFGVPENAAGFLRAQLPSRLANAIDWESLCPQPGSFVDSAFRRSHTDLLFSASIDGRETLLYLLFEHQSACDPRLPLRLLRYLVRIWEDCARKLPDRTKLPPILPVVLSQNAEVWEVPDSLGAMLDLPPDLAGDLTPFLPDFTYRHLQLAETDYASLPGTRAGIFVLRTMKAERRGELLGEVVWEEDLILGIPRELYQMVLRYILAAEIDRDAFENRLNQLRDPELRTDAMTLAQVYRQEGRQKSRQEDILDALELRFGQVSEEIREMIRSQGGEARLRELFRAAIQCTSLEEFRGAL